MTGTTQIQRNQHGRGRRLAFSSRSRLDAGNATPNSTAVARHVRPPAAELTTRSRRSCGPAFPDEAAIFSAFAAVLS